MKRALIISSTRAHADPRETLRIQDNVSFLLARGWSVDLLTPRNTHLLDVTLPKAARVFTIPRIPFTENPPRRPSIRRFITGTLMFLRGIALAARRGYDILHGINDGVIIARAISRGAMRRCPYVAELHEPFSARSLHHGPVAFIGRRMEISAVRHAGAIIFPEEDTFATFDGPIPKSRVSFIPDPHVELDANAFTGAEFASALEHIYAYVLR